jgi:hypothetical protein
MTFKFKLLSYNATTGMHEVVPNSLELNYNKSKLTTSELQQAFTDFFDRYQGYLDLSENNGNNIINNGNNIVNACVELTLTDNHNYNHALWNSFDSHSDFLNQRFQEGIKWLGEHGLLENDL